MRASASRCFSPPERSRADVSADPLQIKLFQYHIRFLAGACPVMAGQFENKFKIGFCRTAQQNRILFHIAKTPIINALERPTRPMENSVIRLHQSGQHFEKKRFPCTIMSQNGCYSRPAKLNFVNIEQYAPVAHNPQVFTTYRQNI